jgi:homoserine dehydrogenase
MKPVKVGLIGWGTVGAGAAKILVEEAELIEKKIGGKLILSRIADLDIETVRPGDVPRDILTTDVEDIFQDPEIEIVAELIGGMEPARTFILKALRSGKHVVTANKALLACHGREIMEAALAADRDVLFEASVGGGIPVIRGLKEGLAADRINRVFGILNGTSNYILTKMTSEGMDFARALQEAQKQGYAEADPTFDVEGIDAAHKLVILVALAYGFRVELNDIFVEGISKLDPLDIQFADEFGYVIKLLAISSRMGNQVEARLHPAMLPKRHLLSDVKGPFNAIYINGEAVGDILLYGAGAGMMPTGTAVVGDMIELARAIHGGVNRRVPPMAWNKEIDGHITLQPMDDVLTAYYFRFSALDRPGVLSKISGLLGAHGISISSVIQKGREIDGVVPIVMLTHEAREADVRTALTEIDRLDVCRDKTVLIRLEERL